MGLATIEGDAIVVRIPLEALSIGCEVAWEKAYGRAAPPVITDVAIFAKEFVRELNSEGEDGTTLVHLMLDKAAVRAIENGAEGLKDDDA